MTFEQRLKGYVRRWERILKKGNNMNHFIGWKFGVPVRVLGKYADLGDDEALLIFESPDIFRVLYRNGNFCSYKKLNFYYELIPYKVCGSFSPRYPVCQSPKRIAYCNSGIGEPQMAQIDSSDIHSVKRYPTATLTIDGKTIELSRETIDRLKKELGV